MTMAWESYRDGGVAVGAVITDDAGTVLGSGRNQRFATLAPRGLLAHAEMEALAAVPDDKEGARNTRLYTTLHPCPMCLGAAVVARVGHLAFGAYDPTWLGIEQLPQLNGEVRHRWPTFEGPVPGPIGEWLAVLPRALTPTALSSGRCSGSHRSARVWRGPSPLGSTMVTRSRKLPISP